MITKTYRIPRKLPGFIEADNEGNAFIDSEQATVAQWRAAGRYIAQQNEYAPWRLRAVRQMVRIASAFEIPEDVSLLPRLRAIAAANVVNLRR